MSKNSKELAVKYHGDGKLPKKKKKNPNMAEVSKMGYRDDSPYKSMPYIDIHTPNGTIDMSATGIPLWANGRVLPPYSGMHQFDSKVVREIPLAQDGGDYNMERAKQLYTPDETGHWPSTDYETGEWLKSKEHPTAWMEYLYGYTLNPQQALRYDVRTKPEGYFGDNTLQYVPKPKEQVGGSIAAKALKKALQQAKKTPIKPKSSGSAHLREMVKMKQSGVNMEDFFENLDWASAGRSLWNNIKRQGAKVLTGGQELGPDASAISAGKRKWTAKNLGLPEENVIVETQKAKYAHPNAVLIDDLPKNVQAFKDAGGKAILHETGNKQKTLKELRQVLSNTPGAQIYTDLDGVLVDLQGGVRKYNAQNSRGIRPRKQQGGWLNKYQTGGQPNNFDFNDLFLTDEEVSANLGELTERRRRCVESGAEGCLSNANAYYNIYVAPSLNAPSSWKELDGAGVISSPENTVDSWDVHGLNNRKVLYNKIDKNQGKTDAETNWKQLNLPIGAIVGFGEHGPNMKGYKGTGLNAKKGLPLAGHSGRVVGYDKNTGEPFIFDTVNGLKRISQNQYHPISVISVDNRIAGNTYDKINSGELSYKGDYDDIEVVFPKDIEHDPDEFIPFIDALTKNKSKYANALGMNTKEYNEFARRAAALSISETEGGNDFIFRSWNGIPVPSYILDQAGVTGSAGITQLNKDVLKTLFNDPSNERRFKSVFGDDMNYNWFQFNNPEHVAFATMLLLKQNKRAAQALNKRGKTNNPNFTDDDLAWYMWNQPSTILKGEAQGDNLNYKKYKNALDMISVGKPLKGKLASKKQGGSTSKLPSHLPEAYQKGGWLKRYQTGGALYSVPRPNVETPMTTRNSSPVTLPTIEVTAERFKRDDLNEFLNKALSSANNQTFAAVSTRAGMSPAQVKSYMDSEGPIARVWDPYTKEFKLKTSARLQQEKAERDARSGTISPLKERSFLENVDRTINKVTNFSMRPGDYGERQREGFLDNFLNPVSIAMYGIPEVGPAIATYQTLRSLSNPEQYVPRDEYGDISIDPSEWAMAGLMFGMDAADIPGFKLPRAFNPLKPLENVNKMGFSAASLPQGMTMDMAKAVYEAKSVGAVEEAIERDLWNAGIIRKNEQVRAANPGGTPTVPKNVSDFISQNNLGQDARYIVDELEKRGFSIDFNSSIFKDPNKLIEAFDKANELLKGDTDKGKLMRAYLNDKKANKGLTALRTEIGKIRALKTDPRVHKQFSDDVNNNRKSAVAPEKLTVHLDDPTLGYRIPIEVQLKPSHVSLDRTDPIGNTGIGLRSFIKDKEDFGYDSTDKPYDQLSYNLSKDGIASHMMFTAADLGTNPSNLTPEQLLRWQKARQFNSGQLMMAAMDMMPAKIVVTEPNMSLDSHKGLMNIGTKPNYKYVTVIDNKGLLNESNPHAELNSIFKGHADNRIIPLAWPNTMAKFSPNVEDYRKFRSVGFYAPDEALMGGLRTQNGLLESTNEMLNKQLEHGHISQQFYDDNVTMWFKDPNDPSKGLTTQAPKISYGDAEFLNMTENERKAWLPQKTSKHPFFANNEKGFNADYYMNASESNVRHMFDDPRVAKMLADDMAQNGSNWMTERSVYSVVGNDDLLSKWNTTAGSGGMGNVTIKQPIPAFSKEYKKFGGEIGGKKLRKGGQNWLSKYK